jgi:hypothetical protein
MGLWVNGLGNICRKAWGWRRRALSLALMAGAFICVCAVEVRAERSMAEIFDIIEDFVREEYLSSWAVDRRMLQRRFSDPVVYYWGKRDVPRKQVIREKMAYLARWPQRYYRLVGDSLEVTRINDNEGVYGVKFRYEFETKRGGATSSGLGETRLLVKLAGDRVIIRGEGGSVLERY